MSSAVKQQTISSRPIRLLHIVESFDTGAVENWLLRVLSKAAVTHPQFHWTFYCALEQPGRFDEKIKRLGGEVIHTPFPLNQKTKFVSHLRKTIKEGDFDILHCHHDFVSAVYLFAALGLPLKQRIVHVHNTDEGLPTPSLMKQLIFKEPMRQTCLRLSDTVVGISNQALSQFTRSNGHRSKKERVVYYGIDTSVFREPLPGREEIRQRLGLSDDAKVLLFVGRMVPLKNPCFVIEVLAELRKNDPNVVAVFSGAGALEQAVLELAKEKGVADAIRVLGWRDDTAQLMRGADLLVFPRLEEPKEGLGLVIVEAQAAGLPILASPSMTMDVQVIPELFEFVPLSAGAVRWADAARQMLNREFLPRNRALELIESSQFSMDAGVRNLMALYEQGTQSPGALGA